MDDGARSGLAVSLETFGPLDIVFNDETGELVSGHQRIGAVCYEPFSGSGSQIIAAEQLGRRCYAMEIEPRYVDVAVARWEKFTGKSGIRADAPEAAHG